MVCRILLCAWIIVIDDIEESIRAAEEDIASWNKQKTIEDGRVCQDDVKEKNSVAQDLIYEENDELKLIESHCNEDLNAISKHYSVPLQHVYQLH